MPQNADEFSSWINLSCHTLHCPEVYVSFQSFTHRYWITWILDHKISLFCQSDCGMTSFVVIHFQGLCQQSSLVLFSKTPWGLSLIGLFSVGKYHGNSAGKSWPLLLHQIHAHNAQTHTHITAAAGFPHQNWAIDILHPQWPQGLTSQKQSKQTQVEVYYQPLDTSSRNSHRSSKLQLVDCRTCKSFFRQQVLCGFPHG